MFVLSGNKHTHIYHHGALQDTQMPEPPTGDVYPRENTDDTRFQHARDDFLDDKAKTSDASDDDAGSYQRNADRELTRFTEWYHDRHDAPPEFDALDATTMRQYARYLARQDWTPGTTKTYYNLVSAFLGWCTREGLLETNIAQADRAKEPIPDDDSRQSGDQQAWSTDDRRQILDHVDRDASQALDALDGGDGYWHAAKALRDRALVAVLAHTGIRAAEFLARRDDRRRRGVRWSDVDLEDGKLTVLSKKQAWDDRSLPEHTIHPLAMLEQLLEPGDDWPVFISLGTASIYPPVRDVLNAAAGDAEAGGRVDSIPRDEVFDHYRRYELTPPALTTDGARRIMQRLTDEAGVDVEDGDYLEPHGGRRGAGEVLVRSHGFAAAARLLDNSERMVRERYSHIEAGALADVATTAFDNVDGTSHADTDTEDGEIPETYR